MLQKSCVFLALLPILSGVALGQSDDPFSKPAWGYFFAGPGGVFDGRDSSAELHFGAGGEGLFAGGFGLAFELGYLTPAEAFSSGVGVLSPGAFYVFNRERKTNFFVNGGFSLFFREGSLAGIYFGGGVNRWFSRHLGWRIEGRDQVLPEHNTHFVEARFGLVVR